MAVVKMKKLTMVGLKQDMDAMVKIIQKSGFVQVLEVKDDNAENHFEQKKLSVVDDKLTEYKFALDLLKEYNPHKLGMFEQKPVIDDRIFEGYLEDEVTYLDNIKMLHQLEEKLSELNNETARIKDRIEVLTPWKDVNIELRKLGKGRNVNIKAGTIDAKNMQLVVNYAQEINYFGFDELKRVKNTVYVLLFFLNDFEENVNNVLNQRGFISLADTDSGTPAEIIDSLQKRLVVIADDTKKINEEIEKIDSSWDALAALYDYYQNKKEQLEKYNDMLLTNRTFFLQGWVPDTYTQKIESCIGKVSPYFYLEFSDPEEDENPPILLKNNAFVTPFELITDLFSMPHKGEIDPNPIMAPFFFMFFGIMLGDVGYGIALSVLMWIGVKLIKPSGQGKKLMDLLFLCGISSAIWGVIFGGWFGDLFGIPALWFNPLDDPITMLIFSLALGVIQIFTGLGIKAYINVKNGHVLDAVYDQGLWLVFLTGLLMMILPNLMNVAITVAIIGGVGLVLTQGRNKKGIVMKFLSGLVSLYGISGYLSDVLSYSRLLALGLSTSVIAMVMNTLAKMFGGGIIGFVLGIIILLIGHVFNLAISGLGSYVHSSRLQYVEFYGKFYEGGGKPFNPFKINLKYYNYQ